MKQKRNLLIGILLGGLLGWTLGFLRLPFIEQNFSFWMGALAGIAVVSLLLLILQVGNQTNRLRQRSARNLSAKGTRSFYAGHSLRWLLLGVFLLAGALFTGGWMYQQRRAIQAQMQQAQQHMAQQAALMEAKQMSEMAGLMGKLLDKVDAEIQGNPQRSLQAETIDRIAALSYACKPYPYVVGDSLSGKSLSPERGQLLLALASMAMDSHSWAKIKAQTRFVGADLRQAAMAGLDLRGADLREADLQEAQLQEAQLDSADLREANLSGAVLSQASLRGADLKRADLRWANLNEAALMGADLSGTLAISASLRKADLSGAIFRWAHLDGAFLNEAKLMGMDLHGTCFTQANLTQADLRESNLKMTTWQAANLQATELHYASIRYEDWFERLNTWQVRGAKSIQERYQLLSDTASPVHFRLVEISE